MMQYSTKDNVRDMEKSTVPFDTASGKDFASYRVLRVVAAWAVVALHALYISYNLFQTQLSGNTIRWARLLSNELMWAVPCFLLVTGALLLAPEKPLTCRKVYTKYLPRVLGALIVWTPLFALFDVVASGKAITGTQVWQAFGHIIFGDGWTHLWYLYLLIGLYLLMPFLQRALTNSSRCEIYILAGILLLFLSIIPFLQNALGVSIGFSIPVTTIFPLYLVLCYGLRTGRFRRLGIPLFLVGTATMAFVYFYISPSEQNSMTWLWSYASLFVIVQAVGLFLMIQQFFRNHRTGRILRILDDTSFGVYLLHMVFIRLFFNHWRINLLHQPGLFVLIIVGIYFLSVLLTFIGKQIPFLKKIL